MLKFNLSKPSACNTKSWNLTSLVLSSMRTLERCDMTELFKICIHHGELKQEDIKSSRRKDRKSIQLLCKLCAKERRPKENENKKKRFIELDLANNPKLTCKKHGVLPKELIHIEHSQYYLRCIPCLRVNQKKQRYLQKERNGEDVVCVRCNVRKPENEYSNYDLKLKYAYCKICRKEAASSPEIMRRSHLKRKFNLTEERLHQMIKEQNNLCFICGLPEKNRINNDNEELTRPLSIDHDHDTNEVRKLLCHGCNAALGLIKENSNTARSMAKYIDEICNKKPA